MVQGKQNVVLVSGEFKLSEFELTEFKTTEKRGQIQRKWDLLRVRGGIRVIRVRVTGVLMYMY